MFRIEVIEKYPVGGEADVEYYENLRIPVPETKYGYRRTMPFVAEIERPIEIVGNKDECIIQFWGGEQIIIKCGYDDFCIRLQDIENDMTYEEKM